MYKYSEVEPMKYAYTNGVLLDGSADMQPQRGMVLRTDGEKILDIVPEGTDLTGFEIVDLKGGYLMPGLINLHVHLPASGSPKKQGNPRKLVKFMTSMALTRRIALAMCEGYAKTQLLSGVTTIRTVGGIADIDTRLRGRIAEGRSAAQAAEDVRRIAQGKPDLIKLMITGGVLDAKKKGEPGELKMPPEYVRAACGEAHRLGLPVAAHVESPEGVRVALENGVDTIEHGAKPDEEILRLFRERGAAQVATLSAAVPYARFDRSVSKATEMEQYNGEVVLEGIIECAKACLAAGIPVGLGTDTGCPYITHYDMWREVRYFHTFCGVSNAFALHTATLGNAKIAGIDGITGSLTPGKSADLIVTAGNPLEDLEALRHVSMVTMRGKLFRDPKVKKMPDCERELDKVSC